jgi:hypothetical protein
MSILGTDSGGWKLRKNSFKNGLKRKEKQMKKKVKNADRGGIKSCYLKKFRL